MKLSGGSSRNATHGIVDPALLRARLRRRPDLHLQRGEASIYALTLRPLWEAVARGDLEVLSSKLTLMETLIGPLKRHCEVLVGSILIPRIDRLRFATRIQSHNPAPADTIPARKVTRFCS